MTALDQPRRASRLREADFLTEVISGVVLALWVVASVISNLNAYFTVEVGVALFVIFIASALYHDYTNKKFNLQLNLDTLRAQQQAESVRLFTTEVQGASSRLGADMELRRATLQTVVNMLAEVLQSSAVPDETKRVYAEVMGRVQDMGRTLFRDIYTMEFDLMREARLRQLQSQSAPSPNSPPALSKQEGKKQEEREQ